MIVSCRKSAPSYSFGSGTRDHRQAQYMGACFDLMKTVSTLSPSPAKYSSSTSVGRQSLTGKRSHSEWRFGTADRSGRMYPDRAGLLPGPGAYHHDSSIGLQTLSKRPSSAQFGFGTGDRETSAKLFTSDLHSLASGQGSKVSPGPAGTSRENSYDMLSKTGSWRPQSAQCGFGTEVRGARFEPRHSGPGPSDYAVKNATFGIQPISRRETAPNFGFGTSNREHQSRLYISNSMSQSPSTADPRKVSTPGPQYLTVSAFAKQPLTNSRSSARYGFGTAPRFKGNSGMRSTPGAGGDSMFTPGPGAYNVVF